MPTQKNKICYEAAKAVLLDRIIANVIHEINNQVCIVGCNSTVLQDYMDVFFNEDINNFSEKIKDIKEDFPSLLEDNQQAIIKIKKITSNLRDFCPKHSGPPENTTNINVIIDFCLEVLYSESKYKATIEKKYNQTSPIIIKIKEVEIFFLNVFIAILETIEKRADIHIVTKNQKDQVTVQIEVIGPIDDNKIDKTSPNIKQCLEMAKDLNLNIDIKKKEKGIKVKIDIPVR